MMISNALEYWKQAADVRCSALDILIASAGPGRTDTDFFRIVDEEISALLIVLSSFRVRRNRESPVSRLPPELLAHIFSFSAAIDTPQYRILGWISVTHVCSHWRRIALDHSVLWANVSFKIGSRWSEEMIQRAKLAPLIIQLDAVYTTSFSEMAVRILRSHLGRTAELCLDGYIPYLAPVAETLTTSAPLLERVEICCFNGERMLLPLDLFGHHAPRLRSACFDGCSIPWSSPLLRNLSHLKIVLSPRQYSNVDAPSYLPSHEEFFDLLANMYQLEYLSIKRYFPRYLPGANASSRMRHPVIKLPNLLSLELACQWSDCAPVLGCIEFPAASKIILDCDDFDSNHCNSVLLPIFERHSGKTGDALPMRTLLIKADEKPDSMILRISGWTTSDPGIFTRLSQNKSLPSDSGLSFQISLVYPNWVAASYMPETLNAILQALHIHQMSMLFFWLLADPLEDYLPVFKQLQSAQHLEYLACENDAYSLFTSTLVHTPVQEGGPINAHDQVVPFPQLQSVKLAGNFLIVGLGPYHRRSTTQVIYVDQLVEILKRREALGVPLQCLEIHLHQNDTDPEDIDKLEAAAQITVIEV